LEAFNNGGRVELTKRADNPESSGVADRPSRDPVPCLACVLVVDDDLDYRRIVALRLGSVGCRCHLAGTHAEALRLLSRHLEIEVAVLDYHMRGADPARLVEQVRAIRPDVTLVGHSSMERREHFAALRVDRFLLKPWTPDQLGEVLQRDRRSFTRP
jgi:CheY-like chemotaxis protein